jgi:hypothetical protein
VDATDCQTRPVSEQLLCAWLATGGPDGRSALPMRGGLFGFWLSLLTVAEAAGLGIILLRHR